MVVKAAIPIKGWRIGMAAIIALRRLCIAPTAPSFTRRASGNVGICISALPVHHYRVRTAAFGSVE